MSTHSQVSSKAAARAYLAPHTIRVRRQQAIAKGVIWAAAGVTILTLVLIVGYILFNGFYTRKVQDFPVTPYVEERVPIAEDGTTMSIVVERSMRIRDITFPKLEEIYTGRLPFLGYLTTQNRQTTAVVYDGDGFAAKAEAFLLSEGRTFDFYGDDVTYAGSAEEIQSILAENDGTIALVPSEMAEGLRHGKVIGLLQSTVIVNPDILQLQGGRRLDHLTLGQVADLISGAAPAWSDVGGPGIVVQEQDLQNNIPGVYDPLPAVPVVPANPDALWAYFDDVYDDATDAPVRENAVTADGLDEYINTVMETPGAIGIIRTKEAMDRDLPILQVERITHWLNLRPQLLFHAPSRAGAVGGLSYIIINTLAMVLFVIVIATPIGVAAAIYLIEYSKQGRLVYLLRLGTDTLAGIPSIIFGLFGMVFFAQFLGFKTGLISGTLTLTLMILPTVIRTSEEALKSVPRDIRDGSLALGATKLQTIFRVVLPAASPGILTGVILGIGRAVGETAAILYTLGSNLALLHSINSPMRVLSVHLYMLIRENVSLPNAFAAATILVVIVFLVNYTTTRLIGRLNRMAGQ